jgi:hypothetical protein
MQMIFYPGYTKQPCRAEYGIALRRDQSIAGADIVVMNSPRAGAGTSLWNTQDGRDIVLNRILTQDLQGVRVEFIRFFVLIDAQASGGQIHGIELPIRLDINDYVQKGNPCQVRRIAGPSFWGRLHYLAGGGERVISYSNHDVVGGCARFSSDFEQRRHLENEEIGQLCVAVGYAGKRDGLPKWLTDQVVINDSQE